MAGDGMLLEIRDLYTNFYTYQGVVKALDGVSFQIGRGEVFGLVGETGCGKSVTANCILRLIPSPPGKIESGNILFGMSSDAWSKKEDLVAKLRAMELEGEKESAEYADAMKELTKIVKEYDLLAKSINYMRKIRGKYISMIFQEPMSALNPVFTAGDQIAETMILHERKDLANAVIGTIDSRVGQIDSFKKAKMMPADVGGYVCSNCGKTDLAAGTDVCPSCGSSFGAKPFKGFEKTILKFYRRFYVTMKSEPDALSLRISSRIPVLRRYEKLVKNEALGRAKNMLKMVRIADPDNVIRSFPYELSGGMQQRVMIAMALACKPALLIADEPTTALDVTIQAQILKVIKDLQRETGTSILLITHNLGVVAETCDRVGVMYAGVMVEIGPVRSIFKEPLHPYTQGMMNSLPKVLAGASRLETIPGSVPNLVRPPSGCRFHPRCPFALAVCKEKKPPMIEVKPGQFTACYLYTEAS